MKTTRPPFLERPIQEQVMASLDSLSKGDQLMTRSALWRALPHLTPTQIRNALNRMEVKGNVVRISGGSVGKSVWAFSDAKKERDEAQRRNRGQHNKNRREQKERQMQNQVRPKEQDFAWLDEATDAELAEVPLSELHSWAEKLLTTIEDIQGQLADKNDYLRSTHLPYAEYQELCNWQKRARAAHRFHLQLRRRIKGAIRTIAIEEHEQFRASRTEPDWPVQDQ